MTEKNRVLIIQQQNGRNYSDAQRYGDLIPLFPTVPRLIYELCVDRAHQMLCNYLHGRDWLLLTGDPVAIGIALSVAADYNDGVVGVLRWNRDLARYEPVTLNLFKDKGR